MRIVQITPGAGGMFCGNCFRDNALVGALRRQGHATTMLPLYLPLTLEEDDYSQKTPIFYSGINVYLDQKSRIFQHAPGWLHSLLSSRCLLKWLARRAANTEGELVGAMTLSMLLGEEGNQARELEDLIRWLQSESSPDVICLSNVLLLGLARRLREALGVPVVCVLQGEDYFLDQLPATYREECWETLRQRVGNVDLFVAPTEYYQNQMGRRLGIPEHRMRVVPNGINLEGYFPAPTLPEPPAIGFFARMCREKGLDTLIDSFLTLKRRPEWKELKLRVGGGLSGKDVTWMETIKRQLRRSGWDHDVSFHPNLSREEKQAFFRSLTILSTPAMYGEAFGLYTVEAMAAGVPVVQPRHAAFPEILALTEGGVLYDPDDPDGLPSTLEQLLRSPEQARAMGHHGREKVVEHYSIERMAEKMVAVFNEALARRRSAASA